MKEALDKAILEVQSKENEHHCQIHEVLHRLEHAQDHIEHQKETISDYEHTVEELKHENQRTREIFQEELKKMTEELETISTRNSSLSETVEHLMLEKGKQKGKEMKSANGYLKTTTTSERFLTNQKENNLLATELELALTQCETLKLEVELQDKRIQELLLEKTRQSVNHKRDLEKMALQFANDTANLKEDNRQLSFKLSILENRLKSEGEKGSADNLSWIPASPSNIESADQALKADFGLSEKWIEDYVFNQKPFTDYYEVKKSEGDVKGDTCYCSAAHGNFKVKPSYTDSHRKEAKVKSGIASQIGSNSKKTKDVIVAFSQMTDQATQVDFGYMEKARSAPAISSQQHLKKTHIKKESFTRNFLSSIPSVGLILVAFLLGLIFRYRQVIQVLRNKLG